MMTQELVANFLVYFVDCGKGRRVSFGQIYECAENDDEDKSLV